jgi:undecaprenyl-diphosphatase
VIVGVIPVLLVGLAIKELVENDLRSAAVIAATTMGFGLLLGWADSTARRDRGLSDITLRDALLIGLAQVLALIPGTSRSGITMTAGLMLGMTREAASRFSFLLAIPTILGSSVLVTLDLLQADLAPDWRSLGLGVIMSAVAAYLCIHLFLRFIERIGMWPFVFYRLALGGVILFLIW